jgi:hypothetical protein
MLFGCTTTYNSADRAFRVGLDPLNFSSRPSADKGAYVIMIDSSVVNGTKVRGWFNGDPLPKRVVHIDGREIPASQVLAFRANNGFYVRFGKDTVIQRQIDGRISIYVAWFPNHDIVHHFIKKDDGPIELIYGNEKGVERIRHMVADCKKAYDMINISMDDYKVATVKNRYFTQSVIEAYNSCSHGN